MKYLDLIGATLFFTLFLTACGDQAVKENAESGTEVPEKTRLITVERISTSTVDKVIQYTATLVPNKEVHYSPAAPGRIEKIYVEVGNRVNQGQVLLEMDKTQLSQAITQLNSATDAYNRISALFETGSIAEQQLEQAKTQLELAQSNVEFLKKNANFTSPVSGIITGKYFENGEMFSGAPNTQAGKAAVVTIQQINPIKAVVHISQAYYPQIRNGMPATFTCDIYPGKTFQGKVYRVYPYVDPMTRTFKTEFVIQNPSEWLKPGMSADMSLVLEKTEGILLPAISVLKQSGTNNRYIFVHEQGKARRIEVEVINRHNDKLEVECAENLMNKELIIEGQGNLLNGSLVEIAAQ